MSLREMLAALAMIAPSLLLIALIALTLVPVGQSASPTAVQQGANSQPR